MSVYKKLYYRRIVVKYLTLLMAICTDASLNFDKVDSVKSCGTLKCALNNNWKA